MTRADLSIAAEEKYPAVGYVSGMRAAYVQGRLDQAKADAQIAETDWAVADPENLPEYIAAAIREAVE